MHVNRTEPSEAELAAAPSADVYLALSTQHWTTYTLDNYYFDQERYRRIIALVDERVPAVRADFRRRLQQLHGQAGPGDTFRQEIDRMLDQLDPIAQRARAALSRDAFACLP